MEHSFCPKCNANSALSIFNCLHRKNNQYCPYKLVESKSDSLRKILIITFCLLAVFSLILINVQHILLVKIITFFLFASLIFIIVYLSSSTIVDYFHSESTGARLEVLRSRGARLPFKYILFLDEFLDVKVSPTKLNYPGSILNVDDYRDKDDTRFLDDQSAIALTNALIVLVVQGFLGITCQSYLVFGKRGNLKSSIQSYSVYKILSQKHKIQAINGNLENLLLKSIGQDAINVSRLVYSFFCSRESGNNDSKWLFESILIKELERKNWGNASKKYVSGMLSKRLFIELDEFHKQRIEIDKEKFKKISSQLQEQYPNLLSSLKKEISYGINADPYNFS